MMQPVIPPKPAPMPDEPSLPVMKYMDRARQQVYIRNRIETFEETLMNHYFTMVANRSLADQEAVRGLRKTVIMYVQGLENIYEEFLPPEERPYSEGLVIGGD
jgi:hypothetical protein